MPNDYEQLHYDADYVVPVVLDLTVAGEGDITDFYNTTADGLDDGICQICHTQNPVNNNLHSGQNQDPHYNVIDTDDGCVECHSHVDKGGFGIFGGFGNSCESCHGSCEMERQITLMPDQVSSRIIARHAIYPTGIEILRFGRILKTKNAITW